MDHRKLTKLPKPSGIKPPQIRAQRLLPSAENLTSSTNAVSTFPKTTLRRSKSYTDLKHMSMTRMLGEPKLHRPFPTKLEPLREHPVNNIPSVATAASSNVMPKLRRRSKSVTEIQVAVKPKLLLKNTKDQKTGTMNKIVSKRKGEKLSDETKPKISKQAKIPDWDYKSRFLQLREKYNDLNEEHKKQNSKMQEFDYIEDKYNALKNDYDVLENKYTLLLNTSSTTASENSMLKEKERELNKTVAELTKECDRLRQLLDSTNAENARLFKENKNLIEENKNLNSDFSNLETSHLLLKDEHIELSGQYDSLEVEWKKTSNENKELNQKLNSAIENINELTNRNTSLIKDVNDGQMLRRKLNNMVQDLKGNIRVFCRVRPPNNSEQDQPRCNINFVDEKVIEIGKSRESISAISGKPVDFKVEFTVDKVFQPECTQEEMFEEVSQLVQSAIDGYDVCVFAYGQTGSGKTYTMQGEDSPERKGLIPRTVDLIFSHIKNLEMAGWNYEISASFLEIYNENIKDLLNPDPIQNLEIRYNEGKGTTVMNLSIQKLNSAQELKDLMAIAGKYRAVAATDFNEHSSRSHAVTKIYLQGTHKGMNIAYTGSVNLVDLAGSESAKTSATERLTETKHINKSLSALESVMLALYNKDKHIPYRNSKLTYLLQSCLGGSSKTLMVVNIAPFEECYTESIYSLRFAAKVKEVKTNAKRNKTIPLPLSAKKT